MKNILVLSSSPRKNGNSNLLCGQFIKGAEETGHATEKVHVHNLNISYCTGCRTCQNNGGQCVFDDDMGAVLEKMKSSDAIVLATPVYFYAMTASLKAMLDRTYSQFLKMPGKDFYYIVTCGGDKPDYLESTIACLKGFVSCYPDACEKGIVYGYGAYNAGDIKGTPAMQEAYAMGKSIN